MATKRPRNKTAVPRLSRDAERLVALAMGMSASGSRLEDRFWETRLATEVSRLLDHGGDAALDSSLDYLYATHPGAYDALIDTTEALAESVENEQDEVLLVAAPVLAWSKYSVFSGALRPEMVAALTAHLQGHIAAQTTRVAVAPYLYSIDQLPRHFSETRELTQQLGRLARREIEALPRRRHVPETAPLLADTRYVLAAFVADRNAPLFAWQEQTDGRPPGAASREQALERWRAQAQPLLASVLTGSVIDLLLPDAYHVSCRESDRAVRPYGVRAGLAFLEAALQTEAARLRAVVGLFGQERGEEYRIGFSFLSSPDIFHGVVWPLYGREEGPEPEGPLEQIEALLTECKIGEVKVLDTLYPLEFCEDCGAPLFADPNGDLVHAELPDDAEQPRAHLH